MDIGERIVSHRGKRGTAGYRHLVKWKGYGPYHTSWEPASQVKAERLVRQYEEDLVKKRAYLGRSRRARLGVFWAGRGGGLGLGGRIAIDAWAIIAGPPSRATAGLTGQRGVKLVCVIACSFRPSQITFYFGSVFWQ